MTRLKEYGSWSEQTSSSGKRYYYNRDTEVSQWEKPAEWKEHEKVLLEKYRSSKSSLKNNSSKLQQSSTRPSTTNNVAVTPVTGHSSSNVSLVNSNSTPVSSSKYHNCSTTSSANFKPSSASNNNSVFSTPLTSLQKSRNSGSLKRPRDGDRQQAFTPIITSLAGFTTSQSPCTSSTAGINNNSNGTPSISSFTPIAAKSARTASPNLSQSHQSRNGNDRKTPLMMNSKSDTKRDETKYAGCYSADSTTTHRRNWSTNDIYLNKNAENATKQSTPALSTSQESFTASHPPSTSSPAATTNKATTTNAFTPISSKSVKNSSPNFSQPRNGNGRKTPLLANSKADMKPPLFNEAKYLGYYRADLAAHRRNWSSDGYLNEARKCAERSARQSTALVIVDEDIKSVRSLLKAAEMRCKLLGQKLTFVRGQITGLEAKNPSTS